MPRFYWQDLFLFHCRINVLISFGTSSQFIYKLLDNKVKVKLSLRLTKHHAMRAHWGSWGIAPRILDLGTRRRWVVGFTPRPLYPKEKSPWFPLDSRLGGPQSRSRHGGEEKNSQPHRESNSKTPIVQPVAQRYTDWAIAALLDNKYRTENNLVYLLNKRMKN
jgi:hypothetical protein